LTKVLEKIRTGGKFEGANGVGANLMGRVARLVLSVKYKGPSTVWGTSSDRTKSSTTMLRLFGALESAGLYGLSPQTTIGVGLV
jgi:hypothetical protein